MEINITLKVMILLHKKQKYFIASPFNLFVLPLIALPWSKADAEFSLNFQPNPNAVSSIANQGCNVEGGGRMGGGGMSMFGPGCGSDYFLQELIDDNGTEYYHVILGDPDVDEFSMEFYMKTGDCCWWSGGGMGGRGGMGGGDAPYSSSAGDTNNRLYNAWQPLEGSPLLTGNGTGNPSRVYLRQINNDGQMLQDFTKDREANKPRIIQVIEDGELTSTFNLDMSNGDYNTYSNPASFINNTTISNIGSFDANADAPNANITAGRYTYTPDNPTGSPHGNGYGTYTYDEGNYDVYSTEWIDYCQADKNPDLQCNFSSGGGGMGRR